MDEPAIGAVPGAEAPNVSQRNKWSLDSLAYIVISETRSYESTTLK